MSPVRNARGKRQASQPVGNVGVPQVGGPQTCWHQGPVLLMPEELRWSRGGDSGAGEQLQTPAASRSYLPLTSCWVARFLTGHGPAPVCSLGVGDPCSRGQLPCLGCSPPPSAKPLSYYVPNLCHDFSRELLLFPFFLR